ncbi:CHAT domain-containing protein [Fulvivirga sp. 29W222]|uniref:CHAT domain-containing protein n=1 Tax=Fulvivirga marina TaxID=2494733 RepID=A0A937FV09_9BACT|nr:CHAT domain-containing protein [Fulvivirga marina]MBL6446454.1 CHAT domain-containing protein [Fulvivirga marina]
MMSLCYEFNGNDKRQLECAKYNINIKTKLLNPNHPQIAKAYIRLARAFAKLEMLAQSNLSNIGYRINESLIQSGEYYRIIEAYQRTLFTLYNLSLNKSHLAEAYLTSEITKASTIHQSQYYYSSVKYLGISEDLITEEAILKKELSFLQSKKIELVKNNANQTEIHKVQNKLFNKHKSYDSLISHLEQNYPEYYNLKYNFDVLSIEEVQQKLKSNEALIEYFNGNDQTYVFTITKDTATFQAMPLVKYDRIEKLRNTLTNSALKNPSQAYMDYSKAAYQLFKEILATPLKNIDTTKINTLRIIPDGLLGLIPFETLLTQPVHKQAEDYRSLPYLFKKFNISYGYSATSMFKFNEHKKSVSSAQVLAFAPSELTPSVKTADLAPLKSNLQEVFHLNNYFDHHNLTGEEATETAFKEKIKDYPIAHLAMHAIIDDEDPMYSKLLFAPSKDTLEDGMLHTFELYNMRLNTQMVVLSACNTGSGKLQKGEGVIAYAGSPSVVMSHWAVDDKSTAELMKHFYKHLSNGHPKDVALRNAKLDFLKNAPPIYHHPYYWNNFVVMGDPAPVASEWYGWKIVVALRTAMFFAMILAISNRHKMIKY